MDTFAEGGMWSYFMWAGGTNFGFWASSSWKSDQSFITTRYYELGPVFEGGALTKRFWIGKSCNLIARNLEPWLTESRDAPLPVGLAGPIRGRTARGPRGSLVFVTPDQPASSNMEYHTDNSAGPQVHLSQQFAEGEIEAAAGVMRIGTRTIAIASPSSVPVVLPYALEIDPGRTVDFANATLFGLAGVRARRVLIFRGMAGLMGIVSINGDEKSFVFSDERPVELAIGGTTVLALGEALADRAWFADGRVIIGPAFVGEARAGGHDCFLDGTTDTVTTVASGGLVSTKAVTPAAAKPAHIDLTGWTAHGLPETAGPADGWIAIDAPRSVEHLGVDQGYSWYSASLHSDGARETALFPTAAKDRLTVFANGERQGVWGRGENAVRDPLKVRLRAGDNRLVFLADNMGRRSEGTELDSKGIFGPAYLDATHLPLPTPVLTPVTAPPSNSWRYQTYRHYYPDAAFRRVSFTVAAQKGQGLTLSLRWVPQFVWIMVDGALVTEHPGDVALIDGNAFSATVLDAYVTAKPVKIDLVYIGEPAADFDAKIKLISYPLGAKLVDWAFRKWVDPTAALTPRAGDPTYWTCQFAMPQTPGPYFLVMPGMSKGHAWLNGRALGRYWSVGPQRSLYVPQSWMRPTNRLAMLDESGQSPKDVYLERDARVSLRSVVA